MVSRYQALNAILYVLLLCALGSRYAASIARIFQDMLVCNQDYIRTAEAKGLKALAIVLKLARAQKCSDSIITIAGSQLGRHSYWFHHH